MGVLTTSLGSTLSFSGAGVFLGGEGSAKGSTEGAAGTRSANGSTGGGGGRDGIGGGGGRAGLAGVIAFPS